MAHRNLQSRILGKGKRLAKLARLKASIKRLHGPARFDLGPRDVVLVVVIKDGEFYLDKFFEHYRMLGVKHFVFVDNGSTDGTIERIKAEPGTVLLQSRLTIGTYEVEFRRHGAQTYAHNHWVLYADVDELFDFEGSETLRLAGLVEYMESWGYTALMAQMLDLFPAASIQSYANAPFEEAINDFRYYDLTDLLRYDYHDYDAIPWSYFMRTNTTSNDELKFMFGGVRKKLFGEMCCLTKHPLVFVDDTTWPNPHPHTAAHVRVADFSAVLKHYKFTNDPFARDRQTLRDGTIIHGADRQRLEVVNDNPDISFYSEDALCWAGVEPLYDQGFLVRSAAFTRFLDARRS